MIIFLVPKVSFLDTSPLYIGFNILNFSTVTLLCKNQKKFGQAQRSYFFSVFILQSSSFVPFPTVKYARIRIFVDPYIPWYKDRIEDSAPIKENTGH